MLKGGHIILSLQPRLNGWYTNRFQNIIVDYFELLKVIFPTQLYQWRIRDGLLGVKPP